MQPKNILFLGFGDVAQRTCARLPEHRCVGVARSPRAVPPAVTFWQGAADSPMIRERLAQAPWHAVVLTLTPTEYSDKAYEVAYVETLRTLIPVLRQNPPGLVLLVSSTSVYHQHQGEWVDETSATEPSGFAGRRLLQAEQLLRDSGLPYCIVRFAGIYGPGRDYLLRQVRAGEGGNDDFSNRIHVDDCAGFIAHLLHLQFAGEGLAPLYIGSDSDPVSGSEVRRWLALQLGMNPRALKPSHSVRGGSKRCRNTRLLASGYELQYPSYRDGYAALLSSGDLR